MNDLIVNARVIGRTSYQMMIRTLVLSYHIIPRNFIFFLLNYVSSLTLLSSLTYSSAIRLPRHQNFSIMLDSNLGPRTLNRNLIQQTTQNGRYIRTDVYKDLGLSHPDVLPFFDVMIIQHCLIYPPYCTAQQEDQWMEDAMVHVQTVTGTHCTYSLSHCIVQHSTVQLMGHSVPASVLQTARDKLISIYS